MVKPGATLIDVGINRVTTREEFDRFFPGNTRREELVSRKRGSTLVGDVDPAAFALSGAYTPVPGGVGPLTIAMLMANTVRAAKLRRGIAAKACAMLRVGLTGGLGSGKTTVAAIFRSLGAQVIEADEIGRAMMQPGEAVYRGDCESSSGRRWCGPMARWTGASWRSSLLREAGWQELNAIVHPAGDRRAGRRWMTSARARAAGRGGDRLNRRCCLKPAVPREPATGRTRFDRRILVTAPEALRIARYVERIAGTTC